MPFTITYSGGTSGADIMVTIVPEPGMLAVLGLALAVLGGTRRRR